MRIGAKEGVATIDWNGKIKKKKNKKSHGKIWPSKNQVRIDALPKSLLKAKFGEWHLVH